MLISEFTNREDILSTVIKELNGLGIKIRSEKSKHLNVKRRNKKIFGVSLHNLELDSGLLSNGSVAQIPKFCLMACRRLQVDLRTEGLFRKTGNVRVQKQMMEQLEKGGSLDRSQNVIDVANLLKTFFRELPEPLIPPGPIQEALLRSLFHFQSYERKCESIMLLMLLLPLITINTLAYFLQFLETVTRHADFNLMTTDNLVKVLTPTIMPVPLNSPPQRLTSHFKVVELLIENSNLLGVVPDRMFSLDHLPQLPQMEPMTEERKKKKRRSGSLNRVFHGLRKIVGAIGSSENLDKSDHEDPSLMTPNVAKSTKKRRLDKLDAMSFSGRKKKEMLRTLSALPEIDDTVTSPRNRRSCEEGSPVTETKRRWSFVGGKHHKNKRDSEDQPDHQEKVQKQDEMFVHLSKSEYESFKDRLVSIETKISHEFNLTKLDALKAEMGENDSLLLNGPEKVQSKFKRTLREVERLEDSERKTEQLAKRLSRDLKIRSGVERSPSARKIGSLRRKDANSRLSRNQSWHSGQSSPVKTSTSFYPKSNLKRSKPIPIVVRPLPDLPRPLPAPPEKPLRTKRESTDSFVTPMRAVSKQAQEVWTPATEFFKDPQDEPEKPEEMFFKTPVRPTRMPSNKSEVKTPMLPPRITPSKRHTPGSTAGTPIGALSLMRHTPSDTSQGRESIITLRNKNAGMVAQKTKLFNGLTDNPNPLSSSASVKIPRAIINKTVENVKCIATPSISSTRSPRRRSPSGIIKQAQFKAPVQSPLLRTIRECSGGQKVKLLRAEVLCEIASPRRKPPSQNNTPSKRGGSRTPRTPKRRQTPSKSPRYVKHWQSNE